MRRERDEDDEAPVSAAATAGLEKLSRTAVSSKLISCSSLFPEPLPRRLLIPAVTALVAGSHLQHPSSFISPSQSREYSVTAAVVSALCLKSLPQLNIGENRCVTGEAGVQGASWLCVEFCGLNVQPWTELEPGLF